MAGLHVPRPLRIVRTAPPVLVERPLDGDQVRDHFQRLGVLLVGVRPAGDLVQVRADPRQLAGALPFQLGVRHRPGPHPATVRAERNLSALPAALTRPFAEAIS